MVDTCRAQGVPEPVYEECDGFVKIVFRKKAAAMEMAMELTVDG